MHFEVVDNIGRVIEDVLVDITGDQINLRSDRDAEESTINVVR